MKIKILFLFGFLYLGYTSTQAQSKHSLLINTGYTANNNIVLNESIVDNSQGYVIDLGWSFRLFKTSFMFAHWGLTGKTIFSSGQVTIG